MGYMERVRALQRERKVYNPAPKVLPVGWTCTEASDDGAQYVNGHEGLAVIVSGCVESDRRRWRHLSVSHRDRLPTWEEVVHVKELFLGVEAKAINVIPPRSQHVNICDRVHHLFSCDDADPLPDFTGGTGSL